jgi:hypothetical protein
MEPEQKRKGKKRKDKRAQRTTDEQHKVREIEITRGDVAWAYK